MDFLTLPDAPSLRLENLTAPAALLGRAGGLQRVDLTLANGVISGAPGDAPADIATVDMKGAMVFPAFTDMHTHLDKGHIWPRSPNPDGSFPGALEAVGADRVAHWSARDVRARMEFSLQSAWAHGTAAIRTHLDSLPPQPDISFPLFREVQAEWAGRIDLQAVCLVAIDNVEADGPFAHTADLAAATRGGVLGAVVYPVPDMDARLDVFFAMAAARGLDADFHVDETGDAAAEGLRAIALAVLRSGFGGRVVVGHCCSLAVQDSDRAERTMDLVAEAGLHVVSLPMCNLYLQDRQAGRTPRWRGVTLVHELAERGAPVSFASDNTRDPFYAYGDMDMIEVMREATRIAHLDHARDDWPLAFTTRPAETCGFAPRGLAAGDPADLVICRARSWTELFARPQADRIVLRGGRAIDRALPDYAELDALMES